MEIFLGNIFDPYRACRDIPEELLMRHFVFMGIPGSILLLAAILWTIPWKATALWRSARNNQIGWFIALVLINTLGILEILYLSFFQKDKNKA